jgi:hypothetical protein
MALLLLRRLRAFFGKSLSLRHGEIEAKLCQNLIEGRKRAGYRFKTFTFE